MSTITEKIDRFVRWFFDVSPTSIETRSSLRPACAPGSARPSSPRERREPRTARMAKPLQSVQKESP